MGPIDGAALSAGLEVERRALVSTLRAVGPNAPTLVDGWSTHDLAAHLAATEQLHGVPTFLGRTLVARRGLRLNDTFAPVMALDLRRCRRRGYDWALQRLERPIPRVLCARGVLPVSVFEVFVHHEDVTRANGLRRDGPVADLVPSIEWLLRYHRRLLGDLAVRVVFPDGTEVGGGREGETVTISGSPAEVMMWLAGRCEAATVSLSPAEVAGRMPIRLTV